MADHPSPPFYSDEALRKQQELLDWPEGSPPPLMLLWGIYEPRIQPTDEERCHHCRSDARDEAGGMESRGWRFCGLCNSRDRDEDYEPRTD